MSTPPAPALDATITKALARWLYQQNHAEMGYDESVRWETEVDGHRDFWIQRAREPAAAVREALLAEGTIHAPDENSVTQWQPFLAIPLEPAS